MYTLVITLESGSRVELDYKTFKAACENIGRLKSFEEVSDDFGGKAYISHFIALHIVDVAQTLEALKAKKMLEQKMVSRIQQELAGGPSITVPPKFMNMNGG